jgi:hypothetical protein
MGVVSHNIQGKLKHAAWSMDVQIEGANVIRHMDMVTQNHMNSSNAVPGIDLAAMAPPSGDPECVELENQVRGDAKNDTKSGDLAAGTVMTRAKVGDSSVKAATPMSNVRGGKTADGYLKPKALVGLERDDKGRVSKGGTEPTIACSDKTYSTKGSGGGGSTHTEAKIIEHAVTNGQSSITMRINWNDGGKLRNDACPMCRRAICIAVKECNMDISICEKNEEGKLEKQKPVCP